jgi:hypothetical protein
MDEDFEVNGRRVVDLKVAELKDELGERGLPKTGTKPVLISRLIQVRMRTTN